jgi:NADP-dependent 3-hydroxy acid dehydrogenase YdfG
MSVQGSSTNLTSKFSRTSLKKATGQISAAKVYNREEELQKATNKRFNSDSWRKVSRNYRAFPSAPANGGVASRNSFSNTQVLYTMSSLTNDEAFLHSKNNAAASVKLIKERRLTRSASYAGSTIPNSPPTKFQRPQTPYSRLEPSQRSERSDGTPATATSSSVSNSTRRLEDRDDFQDCQTGDVTSREAAARPTPKVVQPQSANAAPSLRSAAGGHLPKFTRTLPGRRVSNPIIRRPVKLGESSRSVASYRTLNTGTSKKSGSIRSLLSYFAVFFKAFHYLYLLPQMIKRFFIKPRWTARSKNILITGASSGIGAELARQYATHGARLALIARTETDLERVKEECSELGCTKALYYAADLSNPVSTKLAMKQALKDFCQFDIVILNAGRNQGCYFEEINDVSQIENMIKLNINGAITCLHYALPNIPKTRDSRIVVISNTAGMVAAPYQTVYSATKHALTGFSNSLRMELNNTYGKESPKVCLVTFPEISGTRGNTNRMDMGAKLPPAKWYSWAGQPLSQAVYSLTRSVAAGKREHGQTARFMVWRSLYASCPGWVDQWMMKHVELTHYRPLDECKGDSASSTTKKKEEAASSKPPPNKSWAC